MSPRRRVVVWSDATGRQREVTVVPGRGVMFGTRPSQILALARHLGGRCEE